MITLIDAGITWRILFTVTNIGAVLYDHPKTTQHLVNLKTARIGSAVSDILRNNKVAEIARRWIRCESTARNKVIERVNSLVNLTARRLSRQLIAKGNKALG